MRLGGRRYYWIGGLVFRCGVRFSIYLFWLGRKLELFYNGGCLVNKAFRDFRGRCGLVEGKSVIIFFGCWWRGVFKV